MRERRSRARRVGPEGFDAQRQDGSQRIRPDPGEEIVAAIDAGQLQYRVGVIAGNPWLRLLRREVEGLMESTDNDRDHRQRRTRAELAQVDRTLKKLRAEVSTLEAHRAKLHADLEA